MIKKENLHLDLGLKTAKTSNFNALYFELHNQLYKLGDSTQARFGASSTTDTKEFLNFKTIITNPIERCVGGHNRNINIFFLLAEALWIYVGRKDVAFLDLFNSQLKKYSDDGINYHAPYGYRIRKYGVASELDETEEQEALKHSIDQLRVNLKKLNRNHNDRQCVIKIWNAELDLDVISKDIPCNDLLMFKIRNGKLYQTIQNRSNDLNLGLTTNIFQFSFLGEIMSKILNVELGDQVHNSHSLHIYLNEETEKLQKSICSSDLSTLDVPTNIYDQFTAIPMDFNFETDNIEERLDKVDFFIKGMISRLMSKSCIDNNETDQELDDYFNSLKKFSRFLTFVYLLLDSYVVYRKYKMSKTLILERISLLCDTYGLVEFHNSDMEALALNFFYSRMPKEELLKIMPGELGQY